MLRLEDVSTYSGQIRALELENLCVQPGELHTIIGANGAGQTTLLKTISHILSPKHGEIYFQDKPISHLSTERVVELGISHVPERRQVFSSMTVYDNLLLGAYRRKDGAVRADI